MLCSDADARKHAGGGNSIPAMSGFLQQQQHQQQQSQGGRNYQQLGQHGQVIDKQGAEDGVQGLVIR